MNRLLIALLMFTPAFAQPRGGPTNTLNVTMPTCAAITGACPASGYVCVSGTTIYRCTMPSTWTAVGSGGGGGGLSNGDRGDITVAGEGSSLTIEAGAVTLAKMANLATDKFLVRTSNTAGPPETATVTAIARSLLDDTSLTAMRSTLELTKDAVGGVQPYDADLDDLADDGELSAVRMQIAAANQGGIISTAAQVMGAGLKTFTDGIDVPANATSGGVMLLYEDATDDPVNSWSLTLGASVLSGNYTCTIGTDGKIPDSCIGSGEDDTITAEELAALLSTTGGTGTGPYIFSGATFELPNGAAYTAGDCTAGDATEYGRIFIDTDATSGQQVYVCESSGWTLQGASVGSGDQVKVDGANTTDPSFVGVSGGGDAYFVDTANVVTAIIRDDVIDGDNLKTSVAGKGLSYNSATTPNQIDLATQTVCFTLYDVDGFLDTTDIPSIWRAPADVTLTEVYCEVNSETGAPAMNLQTDDGAAANTMTSDLPCTTAGATTSTFVSGEETLAEGQRLDFLMVEAGDATAVTRMSVCVEFAYD